MNGNRVYAMPSGTNSKNHPHTSSLGNLQSNNRPECLMPGGRRFTDEESANLWSPCSNCSSSDENNSPTALNSIDWDKPALEDKSVDFGWTSSSQVKTDRRSSHKTADRRTKQTPDKKPSGYVNIRSGESKDLATLSKPSPKREGQSRDSSDDICHPTDAGSAVSSEDRLRDPADNSEGDDLQDAYSNFRYH